MAKSGNSKKKVKAARSSIPGPTNVTSPGSIGMVKHPRRGTSTKGSTPASRNPKRSALIPGK